MRRQSARHRICIRLAWYVAPLVAWSLWLASPSAQAAPSDFMRVAVQLEPPALDPTVAAAAPIAEVVLDNVFEGLVRLAADGSPEPLLAESWTVSDDGLSYTFRLRRGVVFHDGASFDAETVRFTLERARAADSLNPMRAALSAIAAVDVQGSDQVRVRLSRRAGSLLQTLGSAALVMVSPATAEANRVRPVGTGPFRFVAWQRGASLTLARHGRYWGVLAGAAGVVFQFISDPSAAYAAVMAGDVDVFSNYPAPENLAQFRSDRRFQVHVGASEGETIVAINHRRAPLDQLAVRRAMAHALDRRAVIDGAMYGHGEPIGSHFSPNNAAYVDLTSRYPHDVARARALLREAGHADGLDLVMKLPPTPYARRSGEIVAAQLAKADIRVRIEHVEWSQWIDQVWDPLESTCRHASLSIL